MLMLEAWINTNSCSDNLRGLRAMTDLLQKAFEPLGGDVQRLPLPPVSTWDLKGNSHKMELGEVLSIRKRPEAPVKIYLGGHMDTVYPATCPFQRAEYLNAQTLRGPGAADMKGGLLILLAALEVLESSPVAQNVGWEALINPDEEIGSLGSRFLICEAAQRNHVGLIFEPAMPDGSLVSERKGSAVFTIVAKGTSAHVGRDFHLGHNAISALARIIVKAEAYMAEHPGVLINVGEIEGGQAVNIVPDQAVCKINVRVNTPQQTDEFYTFLMHTLQHENKTKGMNLTLHEQTSRPPKLCDSKTQYLFTALQQSANSLGYPLEWRPTGGVCDGNLLAAAGLPTLDTLGAIGGNLHTYEEFVLVDSIIQRARLTALFLLRLASGEIDFKELNHD